jgi:DNA polymerase-4
LTVLYAEVPHFYAELERSGDPALADRPVVVGGDPRKRGLVQSATADAIAAGVEVGMPVLEALERCRGVARRTNMRAYREASSRLRACFRTATERVEPAGLEAAYLDPTGADLGSDQLARNLQDRVRAALRLPLRVGIAPVKFLARLAAEEAGSSGVRRVELAEVRDFLAPLPLARLPGVGPNTAATLAELGLETVGALLTAAPATIEERLGNHGLAILAAARGQGESRVRASPHPRSLSQEVTLERGEVDLGVLGVQLAGLAEHLEAALRVEHLVAHRVILKLRYVDGETITRSRTLPHAVSAASDIGPLAEELLARTQAGARPARLVGLGVARLSRIRVDERQLPLFE